MEHAASYSNVVAIGTLLAVQDSADTEGSLSRWMTLEPLRSLKGDIGTTRLRIYFPQISDFGWAQASRWVSTPPVRCLVFAHRVEGPGGGFWALSEDPQFPGGGILRVSGQPTDKTELAAARAVARSIPEAVVRRSSLVLVGEVLGASQEDAHLRDQVFSCSDVLVDSIITGKLSASRIRVFGPYGALDVLGKMVLMLGPGSDDGAYRVIGFSSGCRLIRDDRIVGENSTLPSFIARLRRAIAADSSR
jgi:hypothetical protein